MSFLSKIIDSVNVNVDSAEIREVLQPVSFSNLILPLNYLVQHNKGFFINDEAATPMKEGSFFFRPAGFGMTTKHQKAEEYHSIGPEPFKSEDERLKYFKTLSPF